MPRNFISAPHFLVFCKFSGPWLLSWPFPSPYIKEALSLLEATFFCALKAAYVALGPWPEKWKSCVHYRAPKVVGPLQDRILKSVFAYLYHWGVFGKHKCSEVSIWCALRKCFVLCIFLVGSDTKIFELWRVLNWFSFVPVNVAWHADRVCSIMQFTVRCKANRDKLKALQIAECL